MPNTITPITNNLEPNPAHGGDVQRQQRALALENKLLDAVNNIAINLSTLSKEALTPDSHLLRESLPFFLAKHPNHNDNAEIRNLSTLRTEQTPFAPDNILVRQPGLILHLSEGQQELSVRIEKPGQENDMIEPRKVAEYQFRENQTIKNKFAFFMEQSAQPQLKNWDMLESRCENDTGILFELKSRNEETGVVHSTQLVNIKNNSKLEASHVQALKKVLTSLNHMVDTLSIQHRVSEETRQTLNVGRTLISRSGIALVHAQDQQELTECINNLRRSLNTFAQTVNNLSPRVWDEQTQVHSQDVLDFIKVLCTKGVETINALTNN